jgi:cell division protein FtsQ
VGLAAVVFWASHSTIFELRDLRVRGNHHLSSEDVARLAGLSDHANLVWLSLGGVERRLEANPWIEDVRLSRTLPSALVIEVRERSAVAVAGTTLVADDGMLLGPAPEAAKLPVLSGPMGTPSHGRLSGSAAQLDVIRAVPPTLLGRVERVDLDGDGQISVRLRGGVRVAFGDASRAGEKWAALASVLTWSRIHDVTPASVDVRAPSSPALRVAPAASAPLG